MAAISIAFLIFLIAMVSINYLRSRQHRENVPSSRRGCTEKKYRAVSIRPQLSSCRAVLALADTRFLAEEAPHFPVRGCNAKVCRCQYVYFPDRRDEQRRSPFGARHWAPTLGGERRGGERRQATS